MAEEIVEEGKRHKVLDAVEQAVYYHSRERVRSLRNVVAKLHRTHRIELGTSGIDTGAIFPLRTRPITFRTIVDVTGLAAGVVFEFGNATAGVKMSLNLGNIGFAAGSGAGDDGVGVTAAVGGRFAVSSGSVRSELVAAVNPGTQKVRVWIDGEEAVRGESPDPWPSGEWGTDDDGSVGAAASGTGSNNRAQSTTVAPSNFALVAPLEVFVGQLPRGFEA